MSFKIYIHIYLIATYKVYISQTYALHIYTHINAYITHVCIQCIYIYNTPFIYVYTYYIHPCVIYTHIYTLYRIYIPVCNVYNRHTYYTYVLYMGYILNIYLYAPYTYMYTCIMCVVDNYIQLYTHTHTYMMSNHYVVHLELIFYYMSI